MRYLYLFIILLFCSDGLAAAAAGANCLYEWGVDKEQDHARVVKLADISKMVIASENPDKADLRRSPESLTHLLEGVKNLLEAEPGAKATPITPEIATVTGHCFSYLIASGHVDIARRYMPTLQALLDKGLIEHVENLNYPGTGYRFGVVEIRPGQIGLIMEGYTPRFNNIGRPRLPHEFSNILFGGGHRYAGSAFSEEDWYGIDFDPGIGPHLIGNASNPNVLGLFEEGQIESAVFEYIAWEGWITEDGRFSYLFSDLFRILKPGAVVAILGNAMPKEIPENYLMKGARLLITSAEAAGFGVMESGPFIGQSHALTAGRPVYEHKAASVFLAKPGDDAVAEERLAEIKERLGTVRPFPPEALMWEKDAVLKREAERTAGAGTNA